MRGTPFVILWPLRPAGRGNRENWSRLLKQNGLDLYYRARTGRRGAKKPKHKNHR